MRDSGRQGEPWRKINACLWKGFDHGDTPDDDIDCRMLITVPEHRRMGLGTIALTEGMKKTKALGARYCFGGSREFYTAIGFETVCRRDLWKKEWQRQ